MLSATAVADVLEASRVIQSNSGGVLAFSVSLAGTTSALLCVLEPSEKLPDNRQLYIPAPQRLMRPFPSTNGCGLQMWAQPPKIAGGVTPWFWILAERNEKTPIRTVNRRSVQRQRTQDITERLDQRCAGVCEPRV